MPSTSNTDDDEFGISSLDEADLIALLDAPTHGTKRKASFDEPLPSKRPTSFPCAVTALTKMFGFKSFQLKQEQVRSPSPLAALAETEKLSSEFLLGHIENTIRSECSGYFPHRWWEESLLPNPCIGLL
jgi:hypothetical protein